MGVVEVRQEEAGEGSHSQGAGGELPSEVVSLRVLWGSSRAGCWKHTALAEHHGMGGLALWQMQASRMFHSSAGSFGCDSRPLRWASGMLIAPTFLESGRQLVDHAAPSVVMVCVCVFLSAVASSDPERRDAIALH